MKHTLLGAIALLMTAGQSMAEKIHIAFHVDENDPAVMNMALNNAQNVQNYYAAQGDEAVIEIVAYGPGLNMFVAGKSPVADRISTMSLEIDDITFSACGNTHRKMSQKAGSDVALLPEAQIVPSGVVQLVTLQQKGYAYIRP
jgi:intracellular sulfur oxidation DsrE/DsrF family protein